MKEIFTQLNSFTIFAVLFVVFLLGGLFTSSIERQYRTIHVKTVIVLGKIAPWLMVVIGLVVQSLIGFLVLLPFMLLIGLYYYSPDWESNHSTSKYITFNETP